MVESTPTDEQASKPAYEPPTVRSLGSVPGLTAAAPIGSVDSDNDFSDGRLKDGVSPIHGALARVRALDGAPYEPPAVRELGRVAELTASPDESQFSVTPSDGRLKDGVEPVAGSLGRLRSLGGRPAYEAPALRPLGAVSTLTGFDDGNVGSISSDDVRSDLRLKEDVRRIGDRPAAYEPPSLRKLGTLAELTASVPPSVTKTKTTSDVRAKTGLRPVEDAVRRLRAVAYEPPAVRPIGSVAELTSDEPGSITKTKTVISDVRAKAGLRPVAGAVERVRALAYEPPAVRSLGNVAELTGLVESSLPASDGRLKVGVRPLDGALGHLRSLFDG